MAFRRRLSCVPLAPSRKRWRASSKALFAASRAVMFVLFGVVVMLFFLFVVCCLLFGCGPLRGRGWLFF